MPSSIKKIAVITGATRGLGRAVALKLAPDYHIVALGRTIGALEALDDEIQALGGSTTLVPADLSGDLVICDALGAQLHERFGRLDLLVMAAAILGPLTPVHHLDPSQATKVMQVNYMANVRLVRALDPLLRQSTKAQAVFVTCDLGDESIAYWGNYRASKAALVTLADSYAAETQNTSMQVLKFNPGAMQTRLHHDAFPGAEDGSLPAPNIAAARLISLIN